MNTPLFDKVAFIGIGLIGSSIARVMRRDGLAGSIVACARSDETLNTVLELGLADEVTKDPAVAAQDADLVMICTPVSTYGAIAEAIAPSLKPGAIVTDVGSVKASAIKAVMPHLPEGTHFVPGHPIAGTENSGPESGFDSLFEGRWFLITPPPGTDPSAIDKVAELWKCAGSNIDYLEPEHHDQVLAITSHLPHLIAYTIVGTATDLEDHIKSEVVKYSASGFRDFTRIAASDPVMWRDIFIENRDAVLEMLGRLSEDLAGLQRAIRVGDGDTLEALFRRTREIRRGVIEAGQHIPPTPEDEPPSST
ncbi:MAG: prephenate/arogenate dehydrogenase family protein [Alphaproteobacteria bacterium]|nr:prephenate/arogenate dehydrogenase family protein [Alphaproteobacteria bacterium]